LGRTALQSVDGEQTGRTARSLPTAAMLDAVMIASG
jgi:hypothetical protein